VAQEKERNRRNEAFVPEATPKDLPTPIIPIQGVKQQSALQNVSEAGEPDYNSRMMDKIRRRKEELRNDKNET